MYSPSLLNFLPFRSPQSSEQFPVLYSRFSLVIYCMKQLFQKLHIDMYCHRDCNNSVMASSLALSTHSVHTLISVILTSVLMCFSKFGIWTRTHFVLSPTFFKVVSYRRQICHPLPLVTTLTLCCCISYLASVPDFLIFPKEDSSRECVLQRKLPRGPFYTRKYFCFQDACPCSPPIPNLRNHQSTILSSQQGTVPSSLYPSAELRKPITIAQPQ